MRVGVLVSVSVWDRETDRQQSIAFTMEDTNVDKVNPSGMNLSVPNLKLTLALTLTLTHLILSRKIQTRAF
jgi:hypothetical protein